MSNLRDQWIEALRSGEYLQGRNQLCNKVDGEKVFCCLGVLADIHPELYFSEEYLSFFGRFGSHDSDLPDDILNSVGLDKIDQEDLIQLNDQLGYSFDEIADHLERMFRRERREK